MTGFFSTLSTLIKLGFYAAVILLGVTFAVSNRGSVDLTFYPVPYLLSMPLFIFAVIVFTLGLFTGWSIARFKAGRHKRAAKQATRRAKALENELGTLRSERLVNPASPPAAALIRK